MKEFICKKDFYIEDVKFASIGDYVVLMPDNKTIVNKNNNQSETEYPDIIKDKEYFSPTFESKKFHEVNRPKHYTSGNIECIDAMIAAFGKEAVMTWCKLNAFKYTWREKLKGGLQDMDKAGWYINKYLQLAEQ